MVMSGNLQNFVYISSMKVLYRSGGGGGGGGGVTTWQNTGLVGWVM